MPKWLRALLFGIVGLSLLASLAFVLWANNPLPPMPQALVALESDAQVVVQADQGKILFSPRSAVPDTAIILYPGGRVDFRAYAPLAKEIAAHGYWVFLVKMPLNLAFFNPNAAEGLIAAYPQIVHWAIGGHSLGGAMAANYAKKHPTKLDGLVLWASYPANSDDLSETNLAVLSIYATHDNLATPEKIEASRPLLPPSTQWVAIEGGNHAQFGWYGDQPGDGIATIDRQAQQEQILAATVRFLEEVRTR